MHRKKNGHLLHMSHCEKKKHRNAFWRLHAASLLYCSQYLSKTSRKCIYVVWTAEFYNFDDFQTCINFLLTGLEIK